MLFSPLPDLSQKAPGGAVSSPGSRNGGGHPAGGADRGGGRRLETAGDGGREAGLSRGFSHHYETTRAEVNRRCRKG